MIEWIQSQNDWRIMFAGEEGDAKKVLNDRLKELRHLESDLDSDFSILPTEERDGKLKVIREQIDLL